MAKDTPTAPITDQEMIEVLEEIIRGSGNAAARIAAIRQLRELRAGAPPTPSTGGRVEGSDEDGFAALDELAPRRAGYRAK